MFMVNSSTTTDQFVIVRFTELQLLNRKKDWRGPNPQKFGFMKYTTNPNGGSFKVTKSNGKTKTYKTVSRQSALFVVGQNVFFIR